VVVLLSALAGVLAASAVLGLLAHRSGSAAARTWAAPGHAFTLSVPRGWEAARSKQLASLPSHPVALLRRADGRGTVVVRPSAPVRTSGTALAAGLGRQLRKRFPGFQAVSARAVHVRGGQAFVYTFVHGRGRTVQSLALVATRGRAYAIDAVAPAGAADAAREIGAIVASFGP
jgi:hypothetical protein